MHRSPSFHHMRSAAGLASLAVTSLGIVLLTSCVGDSAPMGQERPGDQSTSAPAATYPNEEADHTSVGSEGSAGGQGAPDMIPTPVQETQTLVSEHLSSWQEYSTASETELQMAFYSGNPGCYGVRSVVQEDDAEVRVATISGTLPDAVDSACTQEARYVALLIELDAPLGDRDLVPLTEIELAP